MFFAANVAPHLVQFGFWIFNLLNINDNVMWIQAVQHGSIDRLEARFFFF